MFKKENIQKYVLNIYVNIYTCIKIYMYMYIHILKYICTHTPIHPLSKAQAVITLSLSL